MKSRKSIVNLYICLGVLFTLTSCRTPGLYTSNPKGKGMAFAGSTFRLTKTDSFFIKSWTDSHSIRSDKDGNRIFEDYQYQGFGTYKCVGDSLELTVSNEDSIMVVLDLKRLNDTVVMDIQRFNEIGNSVYPHLDILDSNGSKIIGSPIVHRELTIHFEILKIREPTQIKLNGWLLNVSDPIVDISNLPDGRHVFKRKSYNGYFRKGEVKKIWFKKVFTGIRYELNDRKRYLPKKFGWSWINKLYRDY